MNFDMLHNLFFIFLWFQSAQNLAQISDLQAQFEEALREKQEVQEKVDPDFLFLAWNGSVVCTAGTSISSSKSEENGKDCCNSIKKGQH